LAIFEKADRTCFGSSNIDETGAIQMLDNFPDDLITAGEAAEDLGVTPQTLADWRCKGHGPDFYKWGRIIRYSQKVNAEWKAKQRRSPRTPP
jgi:hypothetical protein